MVTSTLSLLQLVCTPLFQNPFEVGDEITFFYNNKTVEGFVIDIGWWVSALLSLV